jgi:hypothetical protein
MDCLTVSCYILEEGCKIDWPAWVQAVGSVIGIGAAAWIAYWQNRQVRIASKLRDESRTTSQAQVGNLFALQLNELFDKAYVASQNRNVKDMHIIADKLGDIISWSKMWLLDTYSHPKLKSFVNMRYAAFDLMVFCRSYSSTMVTHADVKTIMDKVADDIFSYGINLPDWMHDYVPTHNG